ncbi:MAG: transposase [Bdellovibrionales bacterium]|nr:transposase [Bdellovibrionales bacterium]
MDFSYLITTALGLQGVTIEKFEFDRSELSLKVFVRQDRASCLCHQCGNQIGYVHEWKERSLRAPPFGAFLYVEVILFQLRGYCLGCDDRIRSAHIPFLYPDFDTLTYSFCEFAGRLMEEMPCEAVARFLNASSKTLWSLDQNRMVNLKPLLRLPENIDLEKMSGDEVHFRTMPKENSLDRPEIKYVTNLVCYDQSKVLANAPGRSERSLLTCLNQLSPEQLAKIKYFSLDMHEPFIKAVRKMCPNARICIDRFHLAEYANNVFDDVRKCEFRSKRFKTRIFQA